MCVFIDTHRDDLYPIYIVIRYHQTTVCQEGLHHAHIMALGLTNGILIAVTAVLRFVCCLCCAFAPYLTILSSMLLI